MSDDEDYMSDKFLQGTDKVVPPSLIYRHTDKRKFNLMKKNTELTTGAKEKKLHVIEQEKRDEGLAAAITSNNKGFEMLMKMGYKPGQGIGKTESGIVEPIGVELKADRHGLGKLPKKKEVKQNIRLQVEKTNMQDFRGRIMQKKAEQLLKADLHRSQKVCEQLDGKRKIEKPYEPWFWQTVTDEAEDDEEDDEECDVEESLPDNEKLEILTKYLRDTYFYCIWCGVIFDDTDDLKDNCPGQTRNDH